MPESISEVTVRRQTGVQRKKQAKQARKRLRLRGARRPKRLTPKQKAAVRKRKGTGFYKKIARLRSSLDLPATITGSISHRPEYIDAVLEAAAEFEGEKQDARAFAKLFIDKDPAFSNTDTGMAAILFEAYIFEKVEEVVEQFLETQLEGSDTTFLAIFEGKIKDEALQKLSTGVSEICTFEPLVQAGDTNHEQGIVSDVTILECTPKRQKKSKAAAQEPEPKLRTEGLLPQTQADYEAILEEGGISDNAFMYLYPTMWEAAKGNNGGIRIGTEPTGVKWYCNEGVWLPDVAPLDEKVIVKAKLPVDEASAWDKDTDPMFDAVTDTGMSDPGLAALAKIVTKAGTEANFKAFKAGVRKVKDATARRTLNVVVKAIEDDKYKPEFGAKFGGKPGGYVNISQVSSLFDQFSQAVHYNESVDEAVKFKTAEQVRDHFFDKEKGYKIKIAGHAVTVRIASVRGDPVTVRWVGKKKGTGFISDFLDAVDPNDKKFPSGGHVRESVDEATLDQAIKKSKLRPALVKNLKSLLKDWMKKSGLGDLTNIKNATVFIDGDKVQVNVEPHKGDRKQFNTRMDQLEEAVNEGFEVTFADNTRANRFAREIRIHARTIRPKGTQVYYEAKEADHRDVKNEKKTPAEEIDELCRRHGGKKKKALKEDKEDGHDIVAGPFLGDGEPRLIHNGHCEVIGFPTALRNGPLYLESEEGFQSKFLSWTVRKEGTDDGKVLVHVGTQMYKLPASLSEVKGLLDKMEEFYVDLPDEFDSMVEAFLQEYCIEKGTKLCHEDVASLRLNTALDEWSSHDFTASRNGRITVRNRLRRLAIGEKLDTVSTLQEAKYVIRTEKGKKDTVLQAIRKKDRTAKVDPEGNPTTAWVTTKLTAKDIRAMDGVEDAVKTTSTQGFGEDEYAVLDEDKSVLTRGKLEDCKEWMSASNKTGLTVYGSPDMPLDEALLLLEDEETCTVEVVQRMVMREGEAVGRNYLVIDGVDKGEIDEAMRSTMLAGLRAGGFTDFKVGEKATTRVVKCPECGGKVLAATGYCVKCKKKTVKKESVEEDLDEAVTWWGPKDLALQKGELWRVQLRAESRKEIIAAAKALKDLGKYKPGAWKGGVLKVAVSKGDPPGLTAELVTMKKSARDLEGILKKHVPGFTSKGKVESIGQYDADDYEDLHEAGKFGLTLEKIKMSGEYQAFKVLKGKSLVGFLMQTGRNTATEEHPWKAFGVSRGQVGEKIGFYYKKDGGQKAALQAIAKTGLESTEIETKCLLCGYEWTRPRAEAMAEDQSCPKCHEWHYTEESVDEAKHYYAVAGALSRDELEKKLGVTLVGYAKGALGKVGARLIQTEKPIKDAAEKADLKVTKLSKAKFMELAESEGEYADGTTQLKPLEEDFQKIAGVKINFAPRKLAFQSKKNVRAGVKALMGREDVEVKIDLVDPQGEVAAVLLKVRKGKLLVSGRDPKNLFQKLKKWRVVKGELTAVYKGATESEEDADFTTRADGDELDEARAGAMTAKAPGVGKITEPTHMQALARKAGKSKKKALELWGKAQAAANEQYPELKAAKGKGGEQERRYYKIVTAIFKSMLGLGKEESENTGPIIAELLCHSCRSTTEVFMYPWTAAHCAECNSVHVTPTGELHYASDEEVEAADPALLEAIMWPGTSKVLKKGQKVRAAQAYTTKDMDNKTVTIKKGTRGRVSYVDTQGEFHVKWATGVETHDMMDAEASDYVIKEAVTIGTPPDLMLRAHVMEAQIWCDGRKEGNIVKKALRKHFGDYDPKKSLSFGLVKGLKVFESGITAKVVVSSNVTPERFLFGLKDALGKTGLQLKGKAFECKQVGTAADL